MYMLLVSFPLNQTLSLAYTSTWLNWKATKVSKSCESKIKGKMKQARKKEILVWVCSRAEWLKRRNYEDTSHCSVTTSPSHAQARADSSFNIFREFLIKLPLLLLHHHPISSLMNRGWNFSNWNCVICKPLQVFIHFFSLFVLLRVESIRYDAMRLNAMWWSATHTLIPLPFFFSFLLILQVPTNMFRWWRFPLVAFQSSSCQDQPRFTLNFVTVFF